jgi:hypothetical protein
VPVPAETPPEAPDVTMQKPPAKFTEDLEILPGYVDVFVESAGGKLGAYDLVINFNPDIVKILRVERVNNGFPGAPMASPESFASGSTRIISLQVGTQVTGSRVAIKNLYDPGSQRILGSAMLSADELVVGR